MSARPYVLAETHWSQVRDTQFDLAILPWGATEAHNLHLPYGTDPIEAEHIAIESARRAWDRGARPVVLPTMPFGVNTQQLDIPLTINMRPSTQASVLADVVESLEPHIDKLVILNAHGGNDFRQMVRELQADTELFLCTLNFYTVLPAGDFFDEPGDHAGELETSLLMHLTPDLVRPLAEAGSGAARTFSIPALREKWVWAPREWTSVTEDTGVGNPALATAAKGKRYFDATCARISDFLVDLSETDPSDLYV